MAWPCSCSAEPLPPEITGTCTGEVAAGCLGRAEASEMSVGGAGGAGVLIPGLVAALKAAGGRAGTGPGQPCSPVRPSP